MKRGDYVKYDRGYDYVHGRVASFKDSGAVFVCFSTGCTAAACNPDRLEVIEQDEKIKNIKFGHHRFDKTCPDYDQEVCGAYCPDKKKGE